MRRDFLGGGLLALMVYLFAAAPAMGIASLINATLQPSQIAMGESAELTITSSGSSMQPVTLPEVAGLEFRIIGQSHRIEIINGATLVTTALIVRVTPQAVGIFTIPGITPKSEPLVLRVNPAGSGSSSVLGNLGSGKSPTGARADGIRLTADGSAFVRLILPKREVYVGESIPVDIEVGMRDGFVTSLNGLPTLTGADFTLNNLSRQPERVPKVIDGKEFTLLTWHSLLAAVKPGKFSLSVESPLTVRIRTRPQRESLLEDSLGDPFMQNFFGATVSKEITVASPPAELSVLSLPAGRPPAFSGAVGSFKIASDLSSATAAAGDPLTLRMQVSGAGNFDRVDSTMLEHLDTWKTYPPKSSFKPGDPVGYKGEKTFEQPLIASKPGVQTLPGVTFSYFDPATRRYETARSAPLAVTISPSLADTSSSAPPASVAAAAATATGTPAAPPIGLRPDHLAATREAGQHSLSPLYLQPRFLALPSLLSLAFAGGWLGLRRRASDSNGSPSGRDRVVAQATQRAVLELQSAARAGNATRFFNVARTALLATIGARLDAEGDEIRQLFALADEANYSGDQPTTTEFERWIEIVRQRLLKGKPA
ncbi:MAG: BatD family protein [Steroidobacteraceae bacterium]